MIVDARGLSCPLPMMQTKQALAGSPAALTVLVDSGCSKKNVSDLLADEGFEVTVADAEDGWKIEARRK